MTSGTTASEATSRISFKSTVGGDDLFTPKFAAVICELHDRFDSRVDAVRATRAEMLRKAQAGEPVTALPPSPATTTDWKVPPVPADLQKPGIEISGPAHVTSMFINALNPGPEGERAEGDLDDDEDAAGHSLEDTITAARNRRDAVLHTLTFDNPQTGRHYEIAPGEIPFFMHRERGWHLDEPAFTIDGTPVSATLLGTALTLFHAGKAHVERGQGIFFYLPKTESPEEAQLYREVFDACRELMPHIKDATIRGIILVESLPAVFFMEEMLYALGPYAAGLNAARWDLKASLLEYVMTDKASVWPDRFDVAVPTTPFIANIFRRLVAICLKHGAVPIGGMATALPSRDEDVNRDAAVAILADKQWEAEQGFIRAWVAHIYHMTPAAAPFKQVHANGLKYTAGMADPDNFPVRIDTPTGKLTEEGTRQNVRVLIEYIEGWLTGRGAKGIDRLAGKPGKRPALMEDLATARISVAQIAQRVYHGSVAEDTERKHDLPLVKKLVHSEGRDIIGALGEDADPAQVTRYRKSQKIALRWIKNYVDLDFRSLGTYTRADLDAIAAAPDSF
jgi:malate synthase